MFKFVLGPTALTNFTNEFFPRSDLVQLLFFVRRKKQVLLNCHTQLSLDIVIYLFGIAVQKTFNLSE